MNKSIISIILIVLAGLIIIYSYSFINLQYFSMIVGVYLSFVLIFIILTINAYRDIIKRIPEEYMMQHIKESIVVSDDPFDFYFIISFEKNLLSKFVSFPFKMHIIAICSTDDKNAILNNTYQKYSHDSEIKILSSSKLYKESTYIHPIEESNDLSTDVNNLFISVYIEISGINYYVLNFGVIYQYDRIIGKESKHSGWDNDIINREIHKKDKIFKYKK